MNAAKCKYAIFDCKFVKLIRFVMKILSGSHHPDKMKLFYQKGVPFLGKNIKLCQHEC
mgnify:CR=1 FL=1